MSASSAEVVKLEVVPASNAPRSPIGVTSPWDTAIVSSSTPKSSTSEITYCCYGYCYDHNTNYNTKYYYHNNSRRQRATQRTASMYVFLA